MSKFAELSFWEIVLSGAVRLATPVAFAALGETIVERSGTLNLGVEGIMLAGALAGVYGSYLAGWMFGLLFGIAVGAVLGALMSAAVLRGGANQIVIGIALTFLGGGLAAYLFQVWLPSGESTVIVDLVPTVRVPGLARLPLIGDAVFHQSLLTYLAVVLVVGAVWMLRNSRSGLALRAVGDDPSAATVRGVPARRVRELALVVGGALAGLGGAAITIGYLGQFTDGVTAGRGFVAIAVVIIGRWTPAGAAAGALLFAFCDSLGLQAQTLQTQGSSLGLPIEAYTALPYLVTLVVLVLTSRNRRAPRSLGQPLP